MAIPGSPGKWLLKRRERVLHHCLMSNSLGAMFYWHAHWSRTRGSEEIKIMDYDIQNTT